MPLDISLHPGQRGILVGKTRTGKSTAGTHLTRDFIHKHPLALALIIDSKPRYRATWKVNGLRTNYKGWVPGDVIENSLAVAGENISLSAAFQKSRVVIVQSRDEHRHRVANFRDIVARYCDELFRIAGKDRPCLLFIDEFYDLCGPSGQVDPRVLATIREGGEVNIAVLAGSQRPRAIPVPILSESDKYYIFFLRFAEDIKRMIDFVPEILKLKAKGHQFVYVHNLNGSEVEACLAQLNLKPKGDMT